MMNGFLNERSRDLYTYILENAKTDVCVKQSLHHFIEIVKK